MHVKQKLRWALLINTVVLLLSFATSVLIYTPTYADYTVTPGQKCDDGTDPVSTAVPGSSTATLTCTGDKKGNNPATNEDGTETCAIEKLGWILCPVIETSGKIGDQAFQFLAKNFLQTEPELVSSSGSGTKVAWELARNIANILFIAAFLIIIMSQVTGRGLDNYGIKKLLPKLIVAAIAVNVSYYICQLMVDLTNIIGFEVQNFMVNTARQVTTSVVMPPQTSLDIQTSSGSLGQIAAGVLGVAAVVWFLLPVLFLGVSTVVITCLVIIAILLMRKAFIVLLVVVSPIAFVAYLLPNTEKYFQKWLNMFWQLLLVFPIVGLLFGAGQLASAIVLVSGSSRTTDATGTTSTQGWSWLGSPTTKADKTTKSVYSDQGNKCIQVPRVDASGKVISEASVKTCGQGSTPFMLGLVAAGIAVAPLIAVWAVLKGALSAAGAIGGKISGAIQTAGTAANKQARRPEDAWRKGMFNAYKARALRGDAVGIGGKTTRFIQRRKNAGEARENILKAAEAGYALSGDKDTAMKNIAAQQQASAAHIAEMQEYTTSGLAGSGSYLGTGAEEARRALDAQKKRALEEVIKGIREGYEHTDVNIMASDFVSAMAKGELTKAKALQEMMLASGSGGIKAFHAAYDTAHSNGNISSADDLSLRQHVQSYSAGAKDKDGSIKAWADQSEGDTTSLTDRFNGDWANIDTIEKFTNLTGANQQQAFNMMRQRGDKRIKEFQSAFLASPNAQQKLSPEMRGNFNLT